MARQIDGTYDFQNKIDRGQNNSEEPKIVFRGRADAGLTGAGIFNPL